ncbi:hypothetical protein MD484_g2113, partial [Candolleomyces efflorescens]
MPVEKPFAPSPKLDEDAEYFWDFVLLSCEGRVFRVPKYRFISDSEVFATKFGLNSDTPSDPSDAFEVVNEAQPTPNAVIELDVSANDFRNFVKALYPRYPEQSLELSKEEWLSVLRLSTKWYFNDFRKRAIDNLTALNLDPVEKVDLGTQFNVSSWLKSGFCELVKRTDIITVEDARRIGLETAIKVYGIRDEWNKLILAHDETMLNFKIEAVFASELLAMYDVERHHVSALERQREEQAVKAKALEKQEGVERQEEHERLQKAVEEAQRALEAHNAALETFQKAQQTNETVSPVAPAQLISTPTLPPVPSPEKAEASPAASVADPSSGPASPTPQVPTLSTPATPALPTPVSNGEVKSASAFGKAPEPSPFCFGAAPKSSAFGTSSFGAPSSSVFGTSSKSSESASAFGTSAFGQTSKSSVFGASASAPAFGQTSKSSIFGAPASTPAFGSRSASKSSASGTFGGK